MRQVVVFQFIWWNLCEAGRWFLIYFQNSRGGMRGLHFMTSDSQMRCSWHRSNIIFAGLMACVRMSHAFLVWEHNWQLQKNIKICQIVNMLIGTTYRVHSKIILLRNEFNQADTVWGILLSYIYIKHALPLPATENVERLRFTLTHHTAHA